MKNENYLVYVLDINGEPMMPTSRFGKVRRMLNSGLAKVVNNKPFVIQLQYEPEHHVVDENLTVNIDTTDPEHIYLVVVSGNNKELYRTELYSEEEKNKRKEARREVRREARIAARQKWRSRNRRYRQPRNNNRKKKTE